MAKVLSSISGNLISAASAGYAPTNSGDVSAIASAYQVVSATGTQLYAGTAFLTEVNGTQLSASRAGQAANASLANSAYYDGTGRLISSLPDSAAVSSIASSYAPTFGLNDGKISSINGSALDTPTGTQVVTATGSAVFDGATGITSINGSALSAKRANCAANDSFGVNIAGNYLKYSSFTGVSSTVANNSASWGAGPTISSPSGTIMVNGGDIEGTNSAVLTATAAGFTSTGYLTYEYIQTWMGTLITDILPGSGGVLHLSASTPVDSADILLSGKDSAYNFVTASATVSGDTRDIVIPLGAIDRDISASASDYINLWRQDVYTAEKTGGVQVTGVAELAWKSAVDNVTNTVSSNSATWGGGGASLPLTGSSVNGSSNYGIGELQINQYVENGKSATAIISGSEARLSYKEGASLPADAIISPDGLVFIDTGANTYSATPASIGSWNGVLNTVSSNSATWGAGGIDSATCSAIASSYAESAVSSKADSSALSSYALSADVSAYRVVSSINTATDNFSVDGEVVNKINGTELRALNATMDLSGRYLTSLPGSSEVSAIASSYAESAVSSKADSSALSSYALSADVSGTVDLVSTQSANWGGSALALSAGPGVKLEMVGSTLVASTDETVLWSGENASSAQLSESYTNFERISFVAGFPGQAGHILTFDVGKMSTAINLLFPFGNTYAYFCNVKANFTDTGTIQVLDAKYVYTPFGTSTTVTTETSNVNNAKTCLQKIIGINRTAGV